MDGWSRIPASFQRSRTDATGKNKPSYMEVLVQTNSGENMERVRTKTLITVHPEKPIWSEMAVAGGEGLGADTLEKCTEFQTGQGNLGLARMPSNSLEPSPRCVTDPRAAARFI